MAILHARGELALGQKFVHESIIGSLYTVNLVEETRMVSFTAREARDSQCVAGCADVQLNSVVYGVFKDHVPGIILDRHRRWGPPGPQHTGREGPHGQQRRTGAQGALHLGELAFSRFQQK